MFIPIFFAGFHPEPPGCTQKKTSLWPSLYSDSSKTARNGAPKTQVMLYGKGAVSPEGANKLTVFRMPNTKVTMEKQP